MPRLDKEQFLRVLQPLLARHELYRVHPDASEPTARAALESLAGLPPYELVYAGDLNLTVVLVAALWGERIPGVEVARRAEMLHERARALSERCNAPVCALQLVVYEREVPPQERAFVISKARRTPLFAARARVGSWVVALAEPAVHGKRLRGWPHELSPPVFDALLLPPPEQAAAPAP